MFDFDVLKISEASEPEDLRPDGRAALGLHTICLDTPVTEVPRGPALTLPPEASVATAVEALRRRARGAAVVVRNHRPIGVVTDRDILAQAGDLDGIGAAPIASVMGPCPEPLQEGDSVGAALRAMCARRQWHLPIVCSRGLFLGALDIADLSLWLRDQLTLISVDAAFESARARL
ncbi:MAG TPA: CBS domain-containing protein [Polyangia bacterium]|nr:CBS domain-containing protein [Polyangia bacterium]